MMKTTEQKQITELASRIFKTLVLVPDDLEVNGDFNDGFVCTLTVRTNSLDTGRIIGESGNTFKAMKSILLVAARRLDLPLHVPRVLEPEKIVDGRRAQQTSPKWNRKVILKLLQDVCRAVFVVAPKMREYDPTNNSTIVEVEVSRLESFGVVELMGMMIPALFTAIGRANARELTVQLVPAPVAARTAEPVLHSRD